MSALPAHLDSPTCYSRVQLIRSDEDLETTQRAVSHWKDRTVFILPSIEKDPSVHRTLNDLAYVCSEFCDSLPDIKKRHLSVLAAFDTNSDIQAVAVYQIKKCSDEREEKKLFVKTLCTAPWNIKKLSSVLFAEKPVYGGGVLLMHTMYSLALNDSDCKEIILYSSSTGMKFYRKIGMAPSMLNTFTFNMEDREQKEQLQKVFSSSFGSSFSYEFS